MDAWRYFGVAELDETHIQEVIFFVETISREELAAKADSPEHKRQVAKILGENTGTWGPDNEYGQNSDLGRWKRHMKNSANYMWEDDDDD